MHPQGGNRLRVVLVKKIIYIKYRIMQKEARSQGCAVFVFAIGEARRERSERRAVAQRRKQTGAPLRANGTPSY